MQAETAFDRRGNIDWSLKNPKRRAKLPLADATPQYGDVLL
jgi:hypothetical protein